MSCIQVVSKHGQQHILAVLLLQPLSSGGVAKVITSNNSNFKEGDIVSGLLQWASYSVVPKGQGLMKIDPSAGAPLAYYLGVLGELLMLQATMVITCT